MKTPFFCTEGVQRNSVLKIGFYGTEGIFGTGNGLLGYGMDIRVVREAAKQPPERKTTTRAQQSPDRKSTAGAQEARPQYIATDYNRVNA